MDLEKKLKTAKAKMLLSAPFFGILSAQLPMNIKKTFYGTAETNGKCINWDPDFLEKIPDDEVRFVMAHEIMHVVFEHSCRRGGRDPMRFNMAADYAINVILDDNGFKAPSWVLKDEKYRGMTAEEIYKSFPVDKCPMCGGSIGDEDDQDGEDGQDGEGEEKEGEGEGKCKQGKCGKNCKNPGHSHGKGKKCNCKFFRDVLDGPMSEDQKRELRQKVRDGLEISKARGLYPKGMDRFLEDLLEPKLPWREILNRFLTQKINNDYSWSRPSPRHTPSNIYLPHLQNPTLGKIVFAVDTSGSMTDKELKMVGGEIYAAVSAYNAEAEIVYCDADISSREEISSDHFVMHPSGGGGTDFAPVFEAVEDATCLVYLTDGYCDSFGKEPEYPVLWVLTHRFDSFNPPFGEVIYIEED